MTNPFDPKLYDRGPLTSGLRNPEDNRTHIDRLNGPWPCGPAVLPAIEERETAALALVELEPAKKRGRPRKKVPDDVVAVEDAHAVDHVDAEVVPADTAEQPIE